MWKVAPSVLRRVVKLTDANYRHTLQLAEEGLRKGEVIAVPTDTLYGVVALPEYAHKLFQLKHRSNLKPLGLFVNKVEDIQRYAFVTVPTELLTRLLPGPLTVIFERSPKLSESINPGVPTIGFRIPKCEFVRDLCRLFAEIPLLQTSANLSGSSQSPIRIEDFENLWEKLDLVVDNGAITENDNSALGSTVVDLSAKGHYKIVRNGCALASTLRHLHDFGLECLNDNLTNKS